jgi:hypothetical protein
MSNLVLFQMTERFAADMLTVNLDKTNIIKPIMKYIEATVNTKLLGLQFDNHVYHMIPK